VIILLVVSLISLQSTAKAPLLRINSVTRVLVLKSYARTMKTINRKEQYKNDKQAPLTLSDSVTRVLVLKGYARTMKTINKRIKKEHLVCLILINVIFRLMTQI